MKEESNMTTKTQMPEIAAALEYLKNLSVYEMANLADCGMPDSQDSAGAELFDAIRLYLIESLEFNPLGAIEVASIADMSLNVLTHQIWLQFVDLCGYNEDLSDGMALGSTMTQQANYVLASIAERVILVICGNLNLTTDQD